MTFTVFYKSDNQQTNPVSVFNIRDDKWGYPHFLIYEDGEWLWKSAKHFEPSKNRLLKG